MPTYRITTFPCLKRTYLIDAENEDEAWEKYYDKLPDLETEDSMDDQLEPEIEVGRSHVLEMRRSKSTGLVFVKFYESDPSKPEYGLLLNDL